MSPVVGLRMKSYGELKQLQMEEYCSDKWKKTIGKF